MCVGGSICSAETFRCTCPVQSVNVNGVCVRSQSPQQQQSNYLTSYLDTCMCVYLWRYIIFPNCVLAHQFPYSQPNYSTEVPVYYPTVPVQTTEPPKPTPDYNRVPIYYTNNQPPTVETTKPSTIAPYTYVPPTQPPSPVFIVPQSVRPEVIQQPNLPASNRPVAMECDINTQCSIGAYCSATGYDRPVCQCLSTHIEVRKICYRSEFRITAFVVEK